MKRLPWTVAALAAAVLLAGCGEVSNTLKPPPGTANTVTVALDASPNFTHVGIFEAEALGYFSQTDIKVRFITPSDPLSALHSGRAQIAIASEPAIILTRNAHIALASVAAIQQGPERVQVTCRAPKAATKTTTTTTATQTTSVTTPRAHPPLRAARCRARTVARPDTQYASAPTYNGLDFVVTEAEIINHAPIIRRFVQAVGRGYSAARADPASATENLVKLNPSLNYTEQLAGVTASLPGFFPVKPVTSTTERPWGFQTVRQWNAFGSWLLTHHDITDPDAVTDADTNELLAGQGV
jgi:ABC-type nitrate/sulfonate/bicarbonate transport system substrate-binding protein